jgi:exoribonuclease-2
MIAANTALSSILQNLGSPSIQRIVRRPERWPRIAALAQELGETLPEEPDSRALAVFLARRRLAAPQKFSDLSLSVVKLLGPGEYAVAPRDGRPLEHFGLAVHGYTHSTAPNRRYVDLITQRLFKAVAAQAAPPYSDDDLAVIAAHCNERANAARKVERLMRKVAAAVLLSHDIGHVFPAVVTGASPKGVYVRLSDPPAEGRVVRGEEDLDVGDCVRVRLIATDPEHGFIDFANEGKISNGLCR